MERSPINTLEIKTLIKIIWQMILA